MPSTSQGYIDVPLTNLSLRYSNSDFIADKVAPVTPVDHETGLYFVYDKQNLRTEETSRRGMSRSKEIDYQVTTTTYGPIKEHSLRGGIPQTLLNQYVTPLEPRGDLTMTLTEKIMIEKEAALASLLTNTGTITQNISLSGTSQFSDYANSDPFKIIQTGFDTIVLNGIALPNTIVMGWQVWSQLRNHPDLLERVKYASGGNAVKTLKPGDLATLFEVENIYISRAVQNTAVEGQTASMSFVWGKSLQIMKVDPTADLRAVTGVRTFALKNGRKVYNWQDEEPGVGEWVKCEDHYLHLPVAAEAVYSVLTAVA